MTRVIGPMLNKLLPRDMQNDSIIVKVNMNVSSEFIYITSWALDTIQLFVQCINDLINYLANHTNLA
jgi:hypothetical protein